MTRELKHGDLARSRETGIAVRDLEGEIMPPYDLKIVSIETATVPGGNLSPHPRVEYECRNLVCPICGGPDVERLLQLAPIARKNGGVSHKGPLLLEFTHAGGRECKVACVIHDMAKGDIDELLRKLAEARSRRGQRRVEEG